MLVDLAQVVEVLEAHSLEIVGMISQGRYMEFFRAIVHEWSEKLKLVDSVLAVWQKLQRNWSRLEPIFMLSEDIRAQRKRGTEVLGSGCAYSGLGCRRGHGRCCSAWRRC